MHKLAVLIVDDSRIYRGFIANALQGQPDIEMVGSVMNGIKAMEFIAKSPPDLVTLDVEMPQMDGLETLKEIQAFNAEHPDIPDIGVIMVSSHTHHGAAIAVEALEGGAFDLVPKPEGGGSGNNQEVLQNSLLAKIRNYALLKGKAGQKKGPTISATPKPVTAASRRMAERPAQSGSGGSIKAIIIGVSTGGPKALATMLPLLSEQTELPIFIVQHMPPVFTQSLAESLNNKCSHTVIEAREDDLAQKNCVYIAPGGEHMTLRGTGLVVKTYMNKQPPENGCRPSVDVLFRSAAAVYRGDVIAVVLTGMGSDGAKGIGPLKRAGARVIAQDEATSVVWGMPGSAVETGLVDQVAALEEIPNVINKFLRNGG